MRSVLAAAFLLLFLFPAAQAQRPVDSCAEQCKPQDPDVNDPPIRSEGTVNVVLYAHWFDTINLSPLTIDPPDPLHEPDLDAGYVFPTVATHLGVPDIDVDLQANYFDMFPAVGKRWFSGDGTEHYQFEGCSVDDHWRMGPWVLYAYFSAESSTYALPNTGAGLAPLVRVEATWAGQLSSHDDGTPVPIARGTSETFHLLGIPGQPNVYEVRVPLEPVVSPPLGCPDNLPYSHQIRVQLIQLETDLARFTQQGWHIRTGPNFPWRMIVPVDTPLRTESTNTTFEGNRLRIAWNVKATFGTPYDIPFESLRLSFLNAEGHTVASFPPTKVKNYTNHHGGYLNPLQVVWNLSLDSLLNIAADRLELTATNAQGTFLLKEALPAPSLLFATGGIVPAPGLVATMAALLLLGFVVGRHRSPR